MSPLKSLLAATSVAVLCGPAFAQNMDSADQHGWQKPSPEKMAAWHAQMCNDLYARQAGRLAYLQAALSITDAQRGAFDHWRDAKLADAKARSSRCLAHKPGEEHEHDALARVDRREKMLEMRLAEMKSERPALETLYQSLSPQQKEVFDHMGRGHHRGMGEHSGERGERGGHGEGEHVPG